MDFTVLIDFLPLILKGLWYTIVLLILSCIFGFILAIPIGLVQVTGPKPLAWLAGAFCTVIRGTPLLIQLYILYYGLGSLFPQIPWIRHSFMWPVLREGFFYAALAFTLSFAGYEGAVMKGAFASVPKGELEAARAFGMSPFTVLRRIWLPRAFRIVLPTLGGETILQLKATPIAALVTVVELYGAAGQIFRSTLDFFPPMLMVAVIYFALTFLITRLFNFVERQVPQR
ncbi:ABC transporter permease [Taklimakanibacter lacteus]|uniref:ABC transporter permease n=1 Tax=Taklimakanibacter lacteus TaxID=2268456 RepID=UPI000E67496A